jgi:hypothetical protein
MNLIFENWLSLMGFLSAPLMYFLGGRQAKKQELKKGDVEIESAEIDYAVKVRELYESLLLQANTDNDALKSDRDAIVLEFKSEREYFRTQIDDLRKNDMLMQKQFNAIQLAYAKEVEQSQNWEKLHRELTEKFNALNKDHEELKLFCEKLKLEVDKYKKAQK